jgi:hypothetical protein
VIFEFWRFGNIDSMQDEKTKAQKFQISKTLNKNTIFDLSIYPDEKTITWINVVVVYAIVLGTR